MPRNAIATDVADFVLPIRGIADRLVKLLDGREQASPATISKHLPLRLPLQRKPFEQTI